MRKAVIDVGSNSVLLLVAERREDGWLPVLETTEVTGLGEDTKVTGLLGDEGMEKTLKAVKGASYRAKEIGASSIVSAVTMAARIATNTEDFLERSRRQGTPIEVLSGEDEADLGFLAVANDPVFAHEPKLTIVDVGGHSTEIVTAESNDDGKRRILFRKSFTLGTLALRSGVLSEESPDVAARFAAIREIDETLGLTYLPEGAGVVVSLGATATNLVTIREQMAVWQPELVHGAYLDYEEVSKAAGWMMDMNDASRAAIVGIEPGRERSLHIGALILERALHALRVLGTRVSVRGWRHALLEREYRRSGPQ